MSTVQVDTDVLVRLLTPGDPLQSPARNALRVLRRQRSIFYVSVQNVAEFWNVCTRPASARNGLGIEPAEVANRVQLINRWARIVTESDASYDLWQRLVTSHAIRGASVHDARLASVMLASGIEKILTFNGRDFDRYKAEGLEPLAPAELC